MDVNVTQHLFFVNNEDAKYTRLFVHTFLFSLKRLVRVKRSSLLVLNDHGKLKKVLLDCHQMQTLHGIIQTRIEICTYQITANRIRLSPYLKQLLQKCFGLSLAADIQTDPSMGANSIKIFAL
jgi:hypothetical protein